MTKSDQPGIRLIQLTHQKVRLELFSMKMIIMNIIVAAIIYATEKVYPAQPEEAPFTS